MGWFRRSTQQTEVEQIANPLFGAIADTQQSEELQDNQLRSPAGLEQATSKAHVSTSSCSSRGGGTQDHTPAALVLPADDPSCSSNNSQGLADDSCVWTPGTVGPDSPPGPLHVPAGHSKPQASTPKPAHRMSAAAGAQHVTTSTGEANQANSSGGRVSFQDHPGQWSGSSSGSWSAGSAASPCSPAAAEETAHILQQPRSRPTSAIQRHVQLQLQQQQQRSSIVNSIAAGAADEDDMFADMCACLDNLEAAGQLARTESGLKIDKLPAAIAAVRASADGNTRCSSSRPSSAGATPQTASGSGSGSATGILQASNGGSGVAAVRSSDGSVAAASGGSFSLSRQLARGRSRLQASTSNACLAEEDLDNEDSFHHLVLERGPSILRHSSTCTGPSVDPMLVVTVGPDGASVPLTEEHKLSVVQTRPSSGSSGASAGIGGSVGSSSRGSSMDKGGCSSGSAPDSPASLTHTRPPPKAAESLQEQQERQRLQELRQQKQEQVVPSYSCPSPHSPSKASQSAHSCQGSAAGSSRSNSGRDAATLQSPAPDRQQHVGGAGCISSGGPWGSTGAAAVAFDTTLSQSNSLTDAWGAVQTGTAKAPGSMRPPSGYVAVSLQVPLPPRMLSAGAAQSPRAGKAASATNASLAAPSHQQV